jgi:hypothetical protein
VTRLKPSRSNRSGERVSTKTRRSPSRRASSRRCVTSRRAWPRRWAVTTSGGSRQSRQYVT